MSRRLSLTLVLSSALLAGCGGPTEHRKQPQPPAGSKRVTLHVKDMAERLDLA